MYYSKSLVFHRSMGLPKEIGSSATGQTGRKRGGGAGLAVFIKVTAS